MSCRTPISLCLDQGADRNIRVVYRNKTTLVGEDLTGVTSTFVLRETHYKGAFVIAYSEADQIDVTDADTGVLVLELPAALDLDPTKIYFGEWRKTLAGLETVVAAFKFSVNGKAVAE